MGLGIIKAFHNPFFLNYFFHRAFLPVQLCGWMGDRVNSGAYQACVCPGKELKGARQDPRPPKVTANARGHSAATPRAWSRAGRRSPEPPAPRELPPAAALLFLASYFGCCYLFDKKQHKASTTWACKLPKPRK